MSDDSISRQAVVDLVEELETQRLKGDIDLLYAPMIKGVRALPSAQPQRIKGRWLKKESVGRWDDTLWECSECGCLHRDNVFCISGDFNFCPNCGADMRGDEK